jgi:ABC-2 type transport system permease protein
MMNMDIIYYTLSVTWKELQVIVRERAWLVILFLLPLMIGGFFGAGNLVMAQPGEDVIQLEVGLVNQDQGTFGTEMAKVLRSIEALQVTDYGTVSEAEQLVSKGDSTAVIVIPADFSQKIDRYEPTAVAVIVDPAEPEAASVVTGIVKQMASEFIIWGEVEHGIRTVFEEGGSSIVSPRGGAVESTVNLVW